MKTADIREKFLSFFESEGHQKVNSSPLIPVNDPTLLFTNAGMVQFKDVFLGQDKRKYNRATTSQKSLRAGGKHNDLENVGYTARHHTFFEMLGNFSFGDYFKETAIKLSWQLLTEVFKLPKEKLWITVYAKDDEAYDLWHKTIGVPEFRIIRIGDNKGAKFASDNFWQMAETGPCGPCSEIFYDHGEGVKGGPPGSADEDGDRYIEIWNLVFMQFNRDANGVMHLLPKPSVDTGMGLERIAAVLQGVHSNYDIDIFQTLIKAAARETKYTDISSPSLKVLADHIRACAFLIIDGIIPGNEGRSYVLRRIIRRAIRHGYKLGARKPFFHRLIPDLVAEMGSAYPELVDDKNRLMELLKQEEERFFDTIEHGMFVLEEELLRMTENNINLFSGTTAFKLHDTFGFPLDLTADVCRERNMTVDEVAFDKAMGEQKKLARASNKFKMQALLDYQGKKTLFHGYDTLAESSIVLALYRNGSPVNELQDNEAGIVVLDNSPFYAEAGGQVGDCGILQISKGGTGIFNVADTQKIQAEVFGHHGTITNGTLKLGDTVLAQVNKIKRLQIMRHHSATHILHKALRDVLGEQVQQKGSRVSFDKTRFDFTHGKPISTKDLHHIENIVNTEILENTAINANVMNIDDAKKSGAMMLFGEKYGDNVRVLAIGSSKELCGGTHVSRTGDIGFFKIIAQSGVAAGIRRIEAICGESALTTVQAHESQLIQIAELLKSTPDSTIAKLQQWKDERKALESEISKLKSTLTKQQNLELAKNIEDVNGVEMLTKDIGNTNVSALREALSALRDNLPNAIIVLASTMNGKVNLIASVPSALHEKMKAGDLVKAIAEQVGGKGGGKADIAMAGGTLPENINQALAEVKNWILTKQL